MSKNDELDLSGDGAAYIRVSDDKQDMERQRATIQSFLQRHNASIAKHYWFEDEGWARDTADRRPEFQRLIRLAQDKRIRWIVVDKLDRFGTKSSKQLWHYLYLLQEAGCKLYDCDGKEWTAEDDATEISAWVQGKKSVQEPRDLSHRVLTDYVVKARKGEWTGGPVRLGFDVACFAVAEPDKERWRVVLEDRDKRLKVYPDGRAERFDGRRNFPPHNKGIEFMQVVPSMDQAKIDAAVSVFKRYATESVGFGSLARYLNGLGFRSCYGGEFQGCQIEDMLTDPVYIGYPVWNRKHSGKFHRFKDGQSILEPNLDEKQTKNDRADWIHSQRRLFDPLVDATTWAAVREKLENRGRRAPAPRSARQYLAGLVHCAGCGKRMNASPGRNGRVGYFCGTYFAYCRKKRAQDSPCKRNGVFQDELEVYIKRYLEETGRRVDLLLQGPNKDAGHGSVTGKLEKQESDAWDRFWGGIQRVCDYLMRYHPEEYAAILEEGHRHAEEDGVAMKAQSKRAPRGSLKGKYGQRFVDACNKAQEKRDEPPSAEDTNELVAALLQSYRANFDPEAVVDDIGRLDAQHTALTKKCLNLTSPLAIKKTNEEIAELEARLAELMAQQQDAAAVVEEHYRQLVDLQSAIASAIIEMASQRGERSWRHRAENLRAVIQRIECAFTKEGIVHGRHGGRRGSVLSAVTIYPVFSGEPVTYPVSEVDSPRALPRYRGVSRR